MKEVFPARCKRHGIPAENMHEMGFQESLQVMSNAKY